MYKLQILHASDLEGGVDAIENAPAFAAVVEALEAEAADQDIDSILLSAGDNFIPGPFFNAGGDDGAVVALEGFYNALFGLIDESVLDDAADANGDGFFGNDEIDAWLAANPGVSAAEVYVRDVNGDGYFDYFDEIDAQEGRIDIAIMNALGFDASAVGNHEFDGGTDFFENIVNYDSEEGNALSATGYAQILEDVAGHVNFLQEVDTPGALFPYLSANLDFSGDGDLGSLFTDEIRDSQTFISDLLSAREDAADPTVTGSDANDAKFAPATIIDRDGEKIGVVGATTQMVEAISSTGGVREATSDGTDDMAALAVVIQAQVDRMVDAGIDKIILVSHLQQIALETDLATRLSGVDVIVAGGSDTILADGDDALRPGDAAAAAYPLRTVGADGNPVLIVSTDGEYSYVGRLVVTFDDDGVLDLSALDESVDGAYATDAAGVAAVGGDLTSGAAADVAALTETVTGIVTEKDGQVIGETDVWLNGERVSVRTEETNLGDLTADANLAAARAADGSILVSIKNGGGIRASIGAIDPETGEGEVVQANPLSGKAEGEISTLDMENSLRFDNSLATLHLTPEQFKMVLEHAVAAVADGATPGQFPQIGGFAFSFDPEGAAQVMGADGIPSVAGTRVKTIALTDDAGEITQYLYRDGEFAHDAPASIGVVTLGFLAEGGDGYPFAFFDTAKDLGVSEQEAFAAYMTDNHIEGEVIARALSAEGDLGLTGATNAWADAFSSPADGFQVYQRGVSASVPFALQDDTISVFTADALGIVDETDMSPFFGVTDTVNDDTSGPVEASWTFDIAGATGLAIAIDIAAMGDFEPDDSFAFEYSIDGGPIRTLFQAAANTDAEYAYTLASGKQVTENDPLEIDGEVLSNLFETFKASLAGTGSELTLTFRAEANGDEAFAFRDIEITADGAGQAFAEADTAVWNDTRIVNLGARNDSLDAPEAEGAVAAALRWRHAHEVEDADDPEGGAEVVQYDDGKLAVTNGNMGRIDLIDARTGALLRSLDLTGLAGFDGVQSVDIKDGIVAAAIARPAAETNLLGETATISQPGFVALFDAETGALLSTVDVGELPDMITFGKDATTLLVAGEGEKNEDSGYDDDPRGTIALIDLTDPTAPVANVLDFTAFDGLEDRAREAGLRIKEGVSLSTDVEPEYIAVSPDGTRAFVTLQESNGVAVVDLETGEIADILALGTRGFDKAGYGIDADDNGVVEIRTFDNLVGMFMPDAIASFEIDGRTYFATANEGDDRGFDADRVEDLWEDGLIDPSVNIEGLERLKVSTTDGDVDGDGDIDVLHTFSTRSFSIWTDKGELVFDSGSLFEEFIAANFPERFNDDDGTGDENRSDAKGPEPEAIEIGQAYGKTFAFVGMERDSGVFVMDISDPTAPRLETYIPGFGQDNQGPEVIEFIPAEESASGFAQIAVAYEISGTTSLFDLLPENPTIMEIQGRGHVSAYDGREVATSGVVTAVDANGFFMQDPEGDGDDATSDAIFVYTGAAPSVAAGDGVEVSGRVSEYVAGGAESGRLSLTEIVSPEVTVVSTGNALPLAATIGRGGREIPDVIISDDETPVDLRDGTEIYDPEADAIDFYESLEGMRVTVQDAAVIAPTNRYDETWVAADGGADATPGLNGRGALPINAGADGYGDLNPERIQLQYDGDLLDWAAPELQVGDRLSDVTGVMTYDYGNFEVKVTEVFSVETPSTNVAEVSDLVGTRHQLTVATYNVLNLTSAENTGDADDDDDAQIAAIARQIVENLNAPDIIGLQEIQDNSGVSDGLFDGVVDADETLQALSDAVVAAGGPRYRFVDSDYGDEQSHGGVPGGNIRNAYLYNDARVDLVEAQTLTPAALAAYGVTDPNAFEGTRDPLLAVFEFDGEQITLINNHFPSRSGSDPIFGAEHPFAQAGEADRAAAAQAVNEVVDAIVAADPDAKVAVMGDFNTFQFTDEMAEILSGVGSEKVLSNLASLVGEDDLYSYIFDGNAQVLDQMLTTDNLLVSAEADYVHVNTDFADAASDHDPLLARFQFNQGEVMFGLDGDQKLVGGSGNDDLRGNAGDDVLVGRMGWDQLYGGFGDDKLRGGKGQDFIKGGFGDDIIYTGGGADEVLLFHSHGVDKLRDFDADMDHLLIGGFDAGVGLDDVTITRDENREVARISVGDELLAKVVSDDWNAVSLDQISFV